MKQEGDKKSCKFCGAILPRDAKFCVSCGSFLTGSRLFPSTRAQLLTQRRREMRSQGGLIKGAPGRTRDKRRALIFPLTGKKLRTGGVMVIFFLVLAVIVGSVLHSPTGGNTTTSQVAAPSHQLHAHLIICVGDSITQGFADPNNWPYHLKTRLDGNWTVVNQGVGGAKTADMLARMNATLRSNPHLVIILGGTNDLANGAVVPATIEANIRAMCTQVESYGAVPVLCTVPPDSFHLAERDILNAWIAEYAVVKGYPLIDFYSVIDNPQNPGHSNPALVMSDGIHPNAAGYVAMGNAIDLDIFTVGR